MSINGLFSDTLKVNCTRKSRVRGNCSVPIPRRFVELKQRAQTLWTFSSDNKKEHETIKKWSRLPRALLAFVHPVWYLITVDECGPNRCRSICQRPKCVGLNDKNGKKGLKNESKTDVQIIRGLWGGWSRMNKKCAQKCCFFH